MGNGNAIEKKAFLGYIHAYRAMAAMFVVAIHCPLLLSDPGTCGIESIFFKRSTHMFVFISGFIFQHLAARFNWRKFYLKKVQHVILPYLLLSTPIIVYQVFITKRVIDDGEHSIINQIIYNLRTGSHLAPLWFIPMITLFYLVSPLLVKMDEGKWGYKFLPLFIGLSLIYTRGKVTNQETLLLFVHFFSIYLIGMFCSRNKDRLFELTERYFPILLIMVVSIIVFEKLNPQILTEQLQFVQKTMLSISMLHVFHKYEHRIPRQINKIADISFGIYFVHSFVLVMVGHIIKHFVKQGSLPYTPYNYFLVFVVVMMLTIIIIKLVKMPTKSYSRYIIGC